MQNVTRFRFIQGVVRATTDAWLRGWDERNSDNLTLHLNDADIVSHHDNLHQ